MIPPKFDELVNQSDYIVRAAVKSVTSEFAQPGSRKIITWVELEIREVIAGTPPQPLVLRLLGGRIGDTEMIIEGVPKFSVGEEHILFVQGNGRQIYPLVAMMHGVYPIKREPGGGREYVARSNQVPLRDPAEVTLPIEHDATAKTQGRANAPAAALTPAQFTQRIREAVSPGNVQLRRKE